AGGTPAVRIPMNVANELAAKPGDKVLLHLTRSGGDAFDLPVTIAEIARQTRFSRCYAPLELMRRIRDWQERKTNTAYDVTYVYARDINDVSTIREALEKRGYRTASILDSVKRYRQIMLVAGVVLTSLGLIALFTGSVSIFNAAYAAVLRRMREFAIYKTYGATRRMIIAIVLTEAGITAIVSAIVGFAAGGGVCMLLQRLVRAEVDSVLFPIEWWLPLAAFAVACIASLAASILPALRAARLSPTEALRA
ncbi:MAG TPA: FtsX-like permease family protein, partial [Thermoanaerobaculia bacterium]|nr:FtsX-like permease family protein [Thermoanaerobaculia bacterium]